MVLYDNDIVSCSPQHHNCRVKIFSFVVAFSILFNSFLYLFGFAEFVYTIQH